MLDRIEANDSFIHDGFERHRLAAADARLTGNNSLGLSVDDAIAQRGVSESGVDNGMDGADASAGQHRDNALDGKGHVDYDAVAFTDFERAQTVRKAADHAIKLAIGDYPLAAVFSEPDVGNTIEVVALSMAIETVKRNVGLASDKPLVMDAVPLAHLLPLFDPSEVCGFSGPERLRVLYRAFIFGTIILDVGLTLHDGG